MTIRNRYVILAASALLASLPATTLAQSTAAAPAGAAGATPAAASPVDASGPSQLIESAANAMLKELDANRPAFRKDPAKIYAVVDRILLPYFDVDYAARLVLAKHWRTATPEQRKRFVDAFYKSLLNNYGDALVEFTGDRIKVLPAKVEPTATTATVRTEVKRSNGDRIPVNYSLRKGETGWKAWDVTIEGISYVKSFREDFGSEIDQKGIDAVIQRLETQGVSAPGAAGKQRA
jgi:phospholipid transport system substrate-binding protein